MKLKHFSIRDLLWLTLVVALIVGWLMEGRRLTGERDEFKIKLDMANRRSAVQKAEIAAEYQEHMKLVMEASRTRAVADGIRMNELHEKLIEAQR